jgi:hypothetical protein
MNSTESSFRSVAKVLDELVQSDLVNFSQDRVQVVEDSARSYHYKNPHLSWCYRFARQANRNSEIARVTVWISFQEPAHITDSPQIDISCRSEVFQIGKISRWETIDRESMSLKSLQSIGLHTLVSKLISDGWKKIDTVP